MRCLFFPRVCVWGVNLGIYIFWGEYVMFGDTACGLFGLRI